MSHDRILKEKAFHDERFGGDDSARAAADKYYSIMGKPRQQYYDLATTACGNGRLLEYGCATGLESLMWLQSGAHVTGIDISGEAIKKAQAAVAGTPFANRAEYFEMNAEVMDFADNSFDVVVGNGIIHHLDLDSCYAEIARVLKPGGTAVFMEPMGHNALINFYRRLTPGMRTEDEHPLLEADFTLAGRYFDVVDATRYNFTTLVAVPLRSTFLFKPMLSLLHGLDRALFTVPVLRRQAWFAVVHLKNPKK